jgi:FkbM family methyltransferase
MSLVREAIKKAAANIGVRIERAPRCLLRSPDAELLSTLEMVVLPYAAFAEEFVFIQVGAHDGLSNDPIRRLVTKLNWRGVLVEPQQELFASLVRSYQGFDKLRFENAAVASADGIQTLYRVRPDSPGVPSWATQLASFDRRTLLSHEKWIPDIAKLIEEIAVPSLTLSTLARRHGLTELDLLQIDAEGYDAKILQLIPFDTLRPRFIAFEHRHLGTEDYETSCRLLIKNGYLISRGLSDTYAVRKDVAAAISER